MKPIDSSSQEQKVSVGTWWSKLAKNNRKKMELITQRHSILWSSSILVHMAMPITAVIWFPQGKKFVSLDCCPLSSWTPVVDNLKSHFQCLNILQTDYFPASPSQWLACQRWARILVQLERNMHGIKDKEDIRAKLKIEIIGGDWVARDSS